MVKTSRTSNNRLKIFKILIYSQINQYIAEATFIVGLVINFGNVFLIFFQKEINPEIFVKMIMQGSFVIVGNKIDDGFAPRQDFIINGFDLSLQ